MAELTKQEILEKAIQKAVEGGWRSNIDLTLWEPKVFDHPRMGLVIGWRPNQLITYIGDDIPYQAVIFNHDFAKALWGEDMGYIIATEHDETVGTAWQYHLQQMVIADDPIAYLGEHLA